MLVATVLALCACDQTENAERAKYDRPDLVGAYQMIPVKADETGEKVAVLDIRTGNITVCKPEATGMVCMIGHPAFP